MQCLLGRAVPGRLAVALVVTLSGCSETTDPRAVGGPSSMTVLAGQDQSGVVGAELPAVLEVLVTDVNGDPSPGQVVNFKVVSGGGSVFAGAALTSGAGIAKERWTLGTSIADSQRVEVRAVDAVTGEAKTFAVFRATPVADAPATIAVSSGDNQQLTVGTAGDSLTVRVTDRFDNPISGKEVGWAVASGGGSVSPAKSTTNVDGIARTLWTLGTSASGSSAVVASAAPAPAATFHAVSVAAAANHLILSQTASGAAAGAAFAVQPTIQLVDPSGNPDLTATVPVTMTVSAGATTIGTVTRVATSGTATFTNAGLAGLVGDYVLTFSATLGGAPVTVTQPISLVSGPPTRYVVTPSATTAEVGTAVTLSAQLVDGSGNPVTAAGRAVTWVRTGASGTFSPATAVTGSSGVATTTFTVATTTSGSALLTGSDAAGLSGSTSVTVRPGAPSKITFLAQPVSNGYGTSLSMVAAVTDQYGNVAASGPNRTITMSLSRDASTLEGTTSRSIPDGTTATFSDLVIYGSGTGYTLTASSPGLSSVTSVPFDVNAVGVIGSVSDYNATGEQLAVAGSWLYVTTPLSGGAQMVRRLPATGGAAGDVVQIFTTTLATLRAYGDTLYVLSTFVSKTQSEGSLLRIPSNIDPIQIQRVRLSTGDGPFPIECTATRDLESDGTYLYVICNEAAVGRFQPQRLLRVGAGAEPTTLATEMQRGSPLGVGGGYAYFADTTRSGCCTVIASMQRVSTAGSGTPATVVSDVGGLFFNQSGGRQIVADGTAVVWYKDETQTIYSAPASGGSATPRVTGLSDRPWLTIDGNSVLFVDRGDIQRMSLSDFSITTVVAGQAAGLFTFDDRSFYFFSGDGKIKKIRR